MPNARTLPGYWQSLRIQRILRKLCTRCGLANDTKTNLCKSCKSYCRERYRNMIRSKDGREPKVYRNASKDARNS